MSARKVRSGAESSDLNDRTAFVGMFDAHAAHLYDYCLSLLDGEAEAASATRVTLIAAYMLGGRMNEPDRLRAWMFALARRECLSDSPTRKEPWVKAESPKPTRSANGDAAPAEAETGEMPVQTVEPAPTGFEAEIRRAVRLVPREPHSSRPDQYREVLDLVHRHGIAPSELPAILDISAEQAQDLLVAAPVMTSLNNAIRRPVSDSLASVPGSVWRETASVVFDAGQSSYCQAIAADAGRLWADGFPPELAATIPPSQRKMAMTSVGLAAALLAPAALGAGLYALFASSPHDVTRSHDYAIVPPEGTRPIPVTTAKATRAHYKAKHSVQSIFPTTALIPTASATYKATSSAPASKSSSPTVKASPSPITSSPSPGPSSSSPTPTATPSSSLSPGPSSSPGPSPSG